MKIHHVGYLVKKIDKAIESFKGLGYSVVQETVYDSYREVDICFMSMDGYTVELVAPVTKTSTVYELSKKIGNSPYHICYQVDDLEAAIEKFRQERYVICSEPHEAVAISGKRVCFMINPYAGMIELVE